MEIKSGNLEYVTDTNSTTALVPYQDVSIYKSKVKMKIEKTLKRSIDIVGGIVGTVCLIPLTIILYIANLISGDRGPLFYTQE